MSHDEPRDLILVDNKLVDSRYALSPWETRAMLHVLSRMNPDDDPSSPVAVPLRDLMPDGTGGSQWRHLKAARRRLQARSVEVPLAKDEWDAFNWFPTIKYRNSGSPDNPLKLPALIFTFHPELRKYLFDLKQRFTRYDLQILLQFRSPYATRLYQVLKSHEGIRVRVLKVEWMRDRFQMEGKFRTMSNFTARFLDPACAEISEKSDIEVSYEKLKEWKSVTAVRFTITPKKKPPVAILPPDPKPRKPFPQVEGTYYSTAEDTAAMVKKMQMKSQAEEERVQTIWKQMSEQEQHFYSEKARRDLQSEAQTIGVTPRMNPDIIQARAVMIFERDKDK